MNKTNNERLQVLLEKKWSFEYFRKLVIADHLNECKMKYDATRMASHNKVMSEDELNHEYMKELMDLKILLDLEVMDNPSSKKLYEERIGRFENKLGDVVKNEVDDIADEVERYVIKINNLRIRLHEDIKSYSVSYIKNNNRSAEGLDSLETVIEIKRHLRLVESKIIMISDFRSDGYVDKSLNMSDEFAILDDISKMVDNLK